MRTSNVNKAFAQLSGKSDLERNKQKLIFRAIRKMREVKRTAKFLSKEEQLFLQKKELLSDILADADNIILGLSLYMTKGETKFGIDGNGKPRIIIENPDITDEIDILTSV